MNEKEISEIRRRFKFEKNNITSVMGCCVNDKNEMISEFDLPFATLSQDETEQILSVLRKTLSGGIGANLIDIEFTNQQVVNGEEHKLLLRLKDSNLKDADAVKALYSKIIENVIVEGNYLILLVNDKYDVFSYTEDGEKESDSSSVFNYILCCVCPLKMTKPLLSFHAFDNAFHNITANSVVCPPECGFMFPSFDDRATNIYNALYYVKDKAYSQDKLIDALFKSPAPLPAEIQKEVFGNIITDSVSDECDMKFVQAVHSHISGMIEDHKQRKEKDNLTVSKDTFKAVLKQCGIKDEHIDSFEQKYDTEFGTGTDICPKNIIDTKKFDIVTTGVSIKVDPEYSDLISTKVIDGQKYILVRTTDTVEVNGININID